VQKTKARGRFVAKTTVDRRRADELWEPETLRSKANVTL
jgi:hypothetical protein